MDDLCTREPAPTTVPAVSQPNELEQALLRAARSSPPHLPARLRRNARALAGLARPGGPRRSPARPAATAGDRAQHRGARGLGPLPRVARALAGAARRSRSISSTASGRATRGPLEPGAREPARKFLNRLRRHEETRSTHAGHIRRAEGSIRGVSLSSCRSASRRSTPALAARRAHHLARAQCRDSGGHTRSSRSACAEFTRASSPPRVIAEPPQGSVVFAAGDDRTDEDLFDALPESAVSVRVGPGLRVRNCASPRPSNCAGCCAVSWRSNPG